MSQTLREATPAALPVTARCAGAPARRERLGRDAVAAEAASADAPAASPRRAGRLAAWRDGTRAEGGGRLAGNLPRGDRRAVGTDGARGAHALADRTMRRLQGAALPTLAAEAR